MSMNVCGLIIRVCLQIIYSVTNFSIFESHL